MRSKRTKHLDRTINVAAHIWNHSVALHRRYYKLFGKPLKQGQLQKHLAKLRRTRKVSDLGLSDYLSKQKWMCEKRGCLFGQMPRFEPSTKRMSCCGHIQDVALSERIVVCQKCGAVHDRDQNAAQSILEFCRKLWPGAGRQTSSEATRVSTAESQRGVRQGIFTNLPNGAS